MTTIAPSNIRSAFPILTKNIHNQPLVYLDNAATTQKPEVVIEAIANYYRNFNANIHRGIHYLSEQATEHYATARHKVQKFINAKSAKECIFVSGTTKAINLIATSFGEKYITAGDEIIITAMEHHANIVPWQNLCAKKQAKLKIIPILANGDLDLTNLDLLLSKKTKLISIVYVANSLGTINPIKTIIHQAHALNIPVFVDAAQAIAHLPIDVQQLDCDFLAFSGHKMYGPMGIGVLYGKERWLQELPPYETGGDMVSQVTFNKTLYKGLPTKFEPGTMPIPEAIALGTTIDFLTSVNLPAIWQKEKQLRIYAETQLQALPNIKILGQAKNKASIISFVHSHIHPHDISTILDQFGIAVRAGHHCTMPVMEFFQVPATTRLSIAMYNTKEEIDIFIKALTKAEQLFRR